MDIPNLTDAAIRHLPFIILGIWPVNLLTLAVQDHAWGWQTTPPAIMELWEWGAFVAFSLAVIAELGGKMFFALAEHRRKMNLAREEGRQEGRQEGRREERAASSAMLAVLNAAAQTNLDSLPALLAEYRAQLHNGATDDQR